MKTVFFDVDTQLDFISPCGALYVPGAESIVPALARLTRFAADHGIPVISTLDTHQENDPEFPQYRFPAHCVAGTWGHAKVGATLGAPGQRFVKKSGFDCFASPDLPPLLDDLKAERYIVYGVVTEICVQCAAMGLLRTGARVELVEDAVKELDQAKAAEFLRQFTSQGGALTMVDHVCR
ncbi:MAG: cysteine hydrolase [Bryobacterales bacterium]|nr:cysteine hydrolase [Bryobacterales bacterium]